MSQPEPEFVSKEEWSYKLIRKQGSDQSSGGLVLQDVRQRQYLLAHDIRVMRIWVGSITAKNSIRTSFALGSPALPIKLVEGIKFPTQQGLIAPFIPPGIESATYETVDPVLGAKTNSQKLAIDQVYLFTHYSKDPPHEPAGIINAARLYPLLSFRYPQSDRNTRPINYIRVDYRLAIGLERFLDPARNVSVKPNTEFWNKTGLFRDGETLKKALPNMTDIYEAVEKPVRWEVLGQGLDWGGTKSQWDNIHQWPGDELPETPGASHAAHIHWRWGTPATERTYLLPPKKEAGPQFSGFRGPGSSLVDPRIPDQRLRFAITTFNPSSSSSPRSWAADSKGSTARFADLFLQGRGGKGPQDIASGGGTNLVIWISIEARRKPSQDPWEGTFFAHGLFFAHDLEPVGLKVGRKLTDIGEPFRKNTSDTRTWWRPEEPKK